LRNNGTGENGCLQTTTTSSSSTSSGAFCGRGQCPCDSSSGDVPAMSLEHIKCFCCNSMPQSQQLQLALVHMLLAYDNNAMQQLGTAPDKASHSLQRWHCLLTFVGDDATKVCLHLLLHHVWC
jgi:hypothetical protein